MQDRYLRQLRLERIPGTLFPANGFQIHGIVTGSDSFSAFKLSDSEREMICNALSAIMPAEHVRLS